jgi:hypothetical protein
MSSTAASYVWLFKNFKSIDGCLHLTSHHFHHCLNVYKGYRDVAIAQKICIGLKFVV